MSSDKTLFSMDLVAMMAVEDIAEREQKSKEDALISFMESNTAKMPYDDSTKLWWDGPAATAEEYEKEKSRKQPFPSIAAESLPPAYH